MTLKYTKSMIMRVKCIISLYFIYLPNFVTPDDKTDNNIHEYGPDNFKQKIEEMDGNFIMFYAPWCHHCTDFQPIWSELGELVNTKGSKFAIAQINCTKYPKLCQDNDITGYPTLLYFDKFSYTPVEYKGTRDLPSLTLFLSEVFTMKDNMNAKDANVVKIYSGIAYLNDNNIEKFVSKGQHFIMFYAPWCRESQKLAPIWAELAVQYGQNEYIKIGKVNCMENDVTCKNFDIKQYPYLLWIVNGRIMGVAQAETLAELNAYIEKMLLTENHDPDKFMKKKKVLPVARISEETFETFLEKELVFVNFFAPWCAHCMQLNPMWVKLGEKFQNDTRVLIADVDCVRSKPICETEKINGLPTLILYKNKKVVSVEHGSKPLESLILLVNEHLEKAATEDQQLSDKSKTAKDEL